MQHRIARVDLRSSGKLPAAIAQPTPTSTCPALAGKCVITGEHWDHQSELAAIPAPLGIGHQSLSDAAIFQYDDTPDSPSTPVLVVSWAGESAEMTTAEALALANEIEVYAHQLRDLAWQYRHVLQQHTDQA